MELINRTAVKVLKNFPSIYALALLQKKSPLKEWGWFRSFREQQSIDAEGRPMPWLTYGVIEFLSRRVTKDMVVFEYGAGNGTLWWANRARRVDAVEHDAAWYDRVRSGMPDNVDLRLVGLEDGGYAEAIRATGRQYDIVVIDGRERTACSEHVVAALTPAGVIIWDNSNREKYAPGIARLKEQGFRAIEFRGFCPIEFMMSETAILYRPNNCLGI